MTQEMQLIDTIFYFVDTMDEYRQVLENNKILSRVIVFVDETQEIYKDGKLFGGYQKSVEKIEELAEEVRQAMDQSENDMRQLISEIRQQVWDNFTDEVELITKNLEDYADQLDKLKKEFAEGEIEEGQVIQTVDQLKGQINDYVSWKSSIQQEFIQMSRTMDAYNGVLRTFAQRLDTQNDTVTNYEHLLDLKEQSLKEYIESYDITQKVRSILGREMLLQEGLLHDYATITDVDNLTRQSVDTYMNSKTPSWTEVTSWASAGYDAAGRLRPLEIAVAGFDSRIQSAEAQASMFSNWYTENADALAYLKTFANDHSSGFDLTAAFNDRNTLEQVTAKIFAYANSNESTIVFEADKFRMNGQAFTINVNQVRGIGDWILENVTMDRFKAVDGAGRSITINALPTSQTDGVYGIKSSTGGFYFSMDGSGWVANENIKWDAQGNLTIKGNTITPSTPGGPNSTTKFENVYISNYWSKTEFTPTMYENLAKVGDLSGIGSQGLASWVQSRIAAAQLDQGEEINIQELVESSLRNEITKADGLFQGFTRNSDLNAALNGYVRSEGLATEVTGLIYDEHGDLLDSGPLYDSFSHLETLSAALIDQNGNFVIGTAAQQSINAQVNNYMTNNQSLSSIMTWAQDLMDTPSAGFSLSALVHNIAPNVSADDVKASIEAVVDEKTSSIIITADQIELDGETIFNLLTGSFEYQIPIYSGHQGQQQYATVSGDVEFTPEHLSFSNSNGSLSIGRDYMYIDTDNTSTKITPNTITFEEGTSTLADYYSGNIMITGAFNINTTGHYYYNSDSVAYMDSENIIFNAPVSINNDLTITGNLNMNSAGQQLNAKRIVCGNSGLWVQGDSQFDGVCTFNDECDFNNTAEFSQDVDFGSSSNISVGGISTVTQTVSISGKTLTFRKGMLVGITG